MILREASVLVASVGIPAIFANSPLPAPAANELFTWLSCVVCVAGIYYLGLQIVRAHRRTPPIDSDLASLERRLDHRRSVSIAGLHAKVESVEKDLSKQISEQGETLARVEANTETNTASSAELSRKVDVILREMPRRSR